jgi:hypothetical protein
MIWLIILILATSFPVGYLLAYLCKEELVPGRRYFSILAWLTFISAIILLIFYRNLTIILTLFYICIAGLISIYKSFDRKFVR